MFKRSLFLALSLLLVVSFSAFAGEGSDTVGGGKLLPQLRYGYSVSDWRTHSAPANGFRDWDVDAQSYYAQLNWGILNNVDLIGIVGGRSVSLESDSAGNTIDSERLGTDVYVGDRRQGDVLPGRQRVLRRRRRPLPSFVLARLRSHVS